MPVSTPNAVRMRLEELLASGMSYSRVAAQFGVNKGLVWLIVNQGFEPKRADIRKRLGYPIICPRCGMEIEQ